MVLFHDGTLPVRQRRQTHRDAILSVLTADDDREKLRAAARWLVTLRGSAERRHGPSIGAWPPDVIAEIEYAVQGTFEIGALALAVATASRWMRRGSPARDDLVGVCVVAALEGLYNFDHTRGLVSTYITPRMNDHAGEHIRAMDFPGMPRRAFKKKQLIKAIDGRLQDEAAACGKQLTVDQRIDGTLAIAHTVTQEDPGHPVDVTRHDVVRVLFPLRPVPLTDLEAADPHAKMPEDSYIEHETYVALRDAVQHRLTAVEQDVLVRHFGLDRESRMTLSTIGARYGRSRPWAGGQSSRAVKQLRSALATYSDAP